jgi:hypothetical protein
MDSVNLGNVQARFSIGGIAGLVSQFATVEKFVGLGQLQILNTGNASDALREIATISDRAMPENPYLDGVTGNGPVSASGVITTEPSRAITAINRDQLAVVETFAGWDLATIWGFNCQDLSQGPRLRSLNLAGAELKQSCSIAPPALFSEPRAEPPLRPVIEGKYSVMAGETLTLMGAHLTSVKRLQIADVELRIDSISDERITVMVPESLEPGVYDLRYDTDFEGIVASQSVEVLPRATATESALIGRSFPILKFDGKKEKISPKQASQVLHLISNQNLKKVVCTAIYQSQMRFRLRVLALKQALSVCQFLNLAAPKMLSTVQSKATTHEHMVGRVLITFTG